MRISRLAHRVDADARTIRFYEAEAVLPEPRSLSSGRSPRQSKMRRISLQGATRPDHSRRVM
jgi:DNA-binding transcriptional MerR regulator